MTELKPCPFCGGKLFTTYFERGSIDMRGLCCENDDCAINDHIAKEYSKERLDIAINTRPIEDTLQARIAELEAENKYLGNMPIMKVEAPEAVIYENALDVNRELKITVNTQQKRIKELEAMSIEEFALVQHRKKYGEEK